MKGPITSEHFPNVFFARYQVWNLAPREIDELLANGWFRNEQYVQTTLGRYVEKIWKPCLMLRVPMKGFVWKKRLRKRLRLNGDMFDVKVRPFVPRQEIEVLWRHFKSNVHKWQTVPDLFHHLLKGNNPSAFNTYEVAVYKGSDLVAFSLFDRGETSIASLEAAYDIRFSNFSLGIYTMLLELNFCEINGIEYYYPGFYPKDTPMFDYKLRTGNAEFFRAGTGRWVKWGEVTEEDWLLEIVLKRLEEVSQLLSGFGLLSAVKVFNKVSFPTLYPSVANYNFLTVGEGKIGLLDTLLVQVAFDPLLGKYFLFNKVLDITEQDKGVQAFAFEPFKLVGGYVDYDCLKEGIKKMLTHGIEPQLP